MKFYTDTTAYIIGAALICAILVQCTLDAPKAIDANFARLTKPPTYSDTAANATVWEKIKPEEGKENAK